MNFSLKSVLCLLLIEIAKYSYGQEVPLFRQDYTYNDNLKAFYKLHEEQKSFFGAWAICEEEDSTIAVPISRDEINHLKSFKHQIWLGLHDMLVEGTFTTIDGKDITKVYTVWEDEEPNNYGNTEDCVVLSTRGLYNDIPCNLKRRFVCKKELSDVNKQKSESNKIKFRSKYIYIKELDAFYKEHRNHKVFSDAVITCTNEEAQLLIPKTEKEVKYIQNLMNADTWLGVHDMVVEGQFKTIDGKNISDVYIDWESEEPNNFGSDEDCLVLLLNGYTNDIPCHLKRNVICKISGDTIRGQKTSNTNGCETSKTIVRGQNACKGQLIFEENFDQSTVDRKKWIIEHRLPNEDQENGFLSYQHTTISIDGMKMKIHPILQHSSQGFNKIAIINGELDLSLGCTAKMQKHCKIQADSYNILPPVISGRITTRGIFSFKYGKIEIRAKLPRGDWLYPELYLEPATNAYGVSGYESGLMRIAFARGNKQLTSGSVEYGNNVLSGGVVMEQSEPCRSRDIVTSPKKSEPWGNDFHVYGLTWNEDSITLEVDNEVYGTIEPPVNGFKSYGTDTSCKSIAAVINRWATGIDLAPFDQEFHITLGLGVGGVSDFPNNLTKPWKNTSPKAKKAFSSDKNNWYTTWENGGSILVDSVKVWAL